MKRVYGAFALALTAVFAMGCEDITNPIEEFGELEDPYVRMEFSKLIGTPESLQRVVFVATTRIEEDVEIDFTFGGDAVFGEDFVIVDRQGNPRTDVTASGGTATIVYDSEQPLFARDTLLVFVPFDATDGRTLEVEISSAQTASGRPLETGFIDRFRKAELAIEGFVDIPTGTYAGPISGDLGAGGVQVTVTKPGSPVVINGVPYSFVVSDYTGFGAFGPALPWSFNVTSGGNVLAAPRTHAAGLTFVTSIVTGTYNFSTNTLTLNAEVNCCAANGILGLAWSMSVTRQ